MTEKSKSFQSSKASVFAIITMEIINLALNYKVTFLFFSFYLSATVKGDNEA